MNILKNVFNWTVGSFFRTIGRVFAFILIGFIIFQLLNKANIDITNLFMPKLSAATLTSKAVYTEGYWYGNDFNNWGSNNTYSYGLAPFSVQGKAYYYVGNIGTTYSGKAYQLAFGFQYSLTAQKYYDITITFKDRDLTSNVNTTSVDFTTGTSSSTLYGSDISLIGVTNNATSGSNTNKLVVRMYVVNPTSYWVLSIQADPNNITSVNNFGISSITIEEVDTSNSQEVINNATNNTQNIINNNNNNTQQIIDSMNTCTTNKNITNFIQGSISGNEGLPFDSDTRIRTPYIDINGNREYKISYNSNEVILLALFQYDKDKNYIGRITNWTTNPYTFTTNENTSFIRMAFRYQSDTNITTSALSSVLIEGKFCTNKVDNLTGLLEDDDTSSAENKASSFFSNFSDDDHGLSSIITLPLNSIRLMLSDNCVAPHTVYKGATISFPCGEILWSRQGASDLKDFLNIVYGGLICYYIIVNFFLWVNRFKNPENDKIEVVDL